MSVDSPKKRYRKARSINTSSVMIFEKLFQTKKIFFKLLVQFCQACRADSKYIYLTALNEDLPVKTVKKLFFEIPPAIFFSRNVGSSVFMSK